MNDHNVGSTYVPRLADRELAFLLGALPALLIVGPRAAGKTTTARRYARTVVQLDDLEQSLGFRASPDAALRGLDEPVLLDEWQVVPNVLGAVKRAVDANSRPNRFLITVSVRGELDAPTWPGTGRVVLVSMFGMTVRELLGRPVDGSVLDRIDAEGAAALRNPQDRLDLRDYIDLALRSGFPEPALRLETAAQRQTWFESYLEQLFRRDAEQLGGPRDPDRLRRYFEALAANTGGVVSEKTLYEGADINRKTAVAYEQLLKNLYVLQTLPSWWSNPLKRLGRTPKRHLVEPALAAAALRLDANGVILDGNMLGRILDSFVTAQIRAEASIARVRPRLYHLRQEDGRREIDLIIELSGLKVVAVEIKADGVPTRDAAKHLRWLRDELGDRFKLGIVFYTGPVCLELDERIVAAPIASLWA